MADVDEIMEAPGFRFYPTEEELISFYLQQKLQGQGRQDIEGVIPVVYIYDYNPWDLPQLSGERCRTDPQLQEWFFFSPKQEREVKGGRPTRLTTSGYWKATGSPGYVYSSSENKIIGVKRTMVFYRGRARSRLGSKTEWKMNEYMAIHDQPSSSSNPAPSQKGEFTICRVYIKSKCLRAFDRRPAAPPMNRPGLAQHGNHIQPSSSDQHQSQARSRVEIRRCRSSESSSSSENQTTANNNNNDPTQGINNNQGNMETDQQEPLWEWDDSWMNHWNL